MINVLEIQLQTVFFPGDSKQNITSVQAPVLGKKNTLADKSIAVIMYYIASLEFGKCCSTVWVVGKTNGSATTM